MKISVAALAFAALASGTAAATTTETAIIRNTGSTNFTGYTIKVDSNGQATSTHSMRAGRAIDQPVSATLPKSLVDQFFRDLHTARMSKSVSQPCVKSVSFGTTTVVQYQGWTSPDLECPGDGTVIALGSDAKKIAAALHVQGQSIRRVPLMPNEPRRAESPAAQPSATPEPHPSASYHTAT